MYRKYFSVTREFSSIFTCINKSLFLKISYENYMPKRLAGHSKWQNIKSTKEAMDHAKSTTFSKLIRQIDVAVRQKGDNMLTNEKLRDLWEEAKKVNMPKAKFESSVRAAKDQATDRSYWAVFSGPRGVVVGFEVLFANKNPAFIQTKFSPVLKKLKLKLEPHFHELCSEKGIIITDPLPNVENAHEKAMEDAIEIGMDEVFENDDKTLIFECLPDRVDSLQQKLQNKGYNIISSSTELDFKEFIKLSEDELQDLEAVINKLKNLHAEIVRTSYNVIIP